MPPVLCCAISPCLTLPEASKACSVSPTIPTSLPLCKSFVYHKIVGDSGISLTPSLVVLDAGDNRTGSSVLVLLTWQGLLLRGLATGGIVSLGWFSSVTLRTGLRGNFIMSFTIYTCECGLGRTCGRGVVSSNFSENVHGRKDAGGILMVSLASCCGSWWVNVLSVEFCEVHVCIRYYARCIFVLIILFVNGSLIPRPFLRGNEPGNEATCMACHACRTYPSQLSAQIVIH